MNVDYPNLERDLLDGSFRQTLERELIAGFAILRRSGERLPPASHYASQIADIVGRNAPQPLSPALAYEVYQEILAACQSARTTVLAEG